MNLPFKRTYMKFEAMEETMKTIMMRRTIRFFVRVDGTTPTVVPSYLHFIKGREKILKAMPVGRIME